MMAHTVPIAIRELNAAPTLTLQLSGGGLPTINLNLNTLRFGARSLDVTTSLSKASADLLKDMARGGHYATATLTETNAAGQPIAVWVMSTVFLAQESINGSGGGHPTQELKFAFGAVMEVGKTN